MSDYNYKLEKIEIARGKQSMVSVGQSSSGPTFSVLKANSDNIVHRPEFSEIEEGDMVLVTGRTFWEYIKTSPVKEIIDIAQDRVVFRTNSSVYELTRSLEKDEEEDEDTYYIGAI